MKTNDIQQAVSGFTTTAVIGGPLVVRVHKANDVIYAASSRHGFFISVDFKFRQNDALYIGKLAIDPAEQGKGHARSKSDAATGSLAPITSCGLATSSAQIRKDPGCSQGLRLQQKAVHQYSPEVTYLIISGNFFWERGPLPNSCFGHLANLDNGHGCARAP